MSKSNQAGLPSFLETTEHLVNNADQMPEGYGLFEIDGHIVQCSREFREYIDGLRETVQGFVNSCPSMDNLGDNQDYVMAFCRETGLSKPCYNDWCAGCDDDDAEFCSSPDESWRQD